jgi:hypothetical protein
MSRCSKLSAMRRLLRAAVRIDCMQHRCLKDSVHRPRESASACLVSDRTSAVKRSPAVKDLLPVLLDRRVDRCRRKYLAGTAAAGRIVLIHAFIELAHIRKFKCTRAAHARI